ncbi:MAG: NUDIX domain-containing protein [Streptosporangiales bacterium]|nr:NUDIX domain-containing protein [Streptosporangiales bacterium]
MEASQVRDAVERWEVTESQRRFRGRVIGLRTDLVRMPAGDVAAREVVEHPGSVAVLALDEEDRVLLIRQYRHPAGHQLWEAPAGLRDVDGEELRDTAERELLEEAGYRAKEWHTLVDAFTSPGMCDERIRIFLARGVVEVPEEQRDFQGIHEETHLPLAWVKLDEAAAKVLAGEIHNPTAVMGILAAYVVRAAGYGDLRSADAPE